MLGLHRTSRDAPTQPPLSTFTLSSSQGSYQTNITRSSKDAVLMLKRVLKLQMQKLFFLQQYSLEHARLDVIVLQQK